MERTARHFWVVLLVLALSALVACGPGVRDIYPRTPPPMAYEHYVRAQLAKKDGEYAKASDLLAVALAHDPESAHLLAEYVDLLRLRGELDRALASGRELQDEYPESIEIAIAYGAALKDSGRVDEGLAEMLRGLALDPGHIKGAMTVAEFAVEQGKIQVARQALHGLADAKPNYARAWLALGNLAWELDDLPGAIDAYATYLERDMRSELAFLRLADAHRRSDQGAEAEDVLADCVESHPRSRDCKVAFIGAVVRRPETDDLTDRIDTLVHAVPHDEVEIDDQLLAQLSMRLLVTQPLATASPFIERVLERRPELADLAYYLGQARIEDADFGGAVWALDMVPGESELYAETRVLLAQALLALGRDREAHEVASELVRLHPEAAAAHLALSDALVAGERSEEAVAVLHDALELLPKQALSLRLQMALIHEAAGQREKALNMYRELLVEEPVAAADDLGLGDANVEARSLAESRIIGILVDDGQSAEARVLATSALRNRPADPLALIGHARVLAAEGDDDAARGSLAEARRVAPLDPNPLVALAEMERGRDRDAARSLYLEALALARTYQLRRRIELGLVSLDPGAESSDRRKR